MCARREAAVGRDGETLSNGPRHRIDGKERVQILALVGAARNFNERDADIAAMYWNRRRGEHGKIRDRNTLEAYDSLLRDWQEKDALIAKHLDQRGTLKAQQDKDAERFERIERDLRQEEERLRSPERSASSETWRPTNIENDSHLEEHTTYRTI